MKPKNQTVDQLYSQGRTYPSGRHTAQEPSPPPKRHIPDPPASQQKPQAPCDQHAPGYANDSDGWVRGMASKGGREDGRKPSFDFGNAWRGGKLRKD